MSMNVVAGELQSQGPKRAWDPANNKSSLISRADLQVHQMACLTTASFTVLWTTCSPISQGLTSTNFFKFFFELYSVANQISIFPQC